jgi:hypothetical protein
MNAAASGLLMAQARLPPARGRSLHWARLLDIAVIAFVLVALGWLGLTAERRLAYHWDWPAICCCWGCSPPCVWRSGRWCWGC